MFLQVRWPNQQCHSTEGRWLVISETGLISLGLGNWTEMHVRSLKLPRTTVCFRVTLVTNSFAKSKLIWPNVHLKNRSTEGFFSGRLHRACALGQTDTASAQGRCNNLEGKVRYRIGCTVEHAKMMFGDQNLIVFFRCVLDDKIL